MSIRPAQPGDEPQPSLWQLRIAGIVNGALLVVTLLYLVQLLWS